MKKVLLSNDDGYQCAGYYPLLKALKAEFDVTAVAPSSQRSWSGKSISGHGELAYAEVELEGEKVLAIDGTPADCVQIGLHNVMPDRPDYVVSGINNGSNIGRARILSSGTIGAAMEGALDGVMSFAVSLCGTSGRGIDYFIPESYQYFESAAKITVKVIKMLEKAPIDKDIDLISINIPFGVSPNAPIEVTIPFTNHYGQIFAKEGNVYKHIGAPIRDEDMEKETDIQAIRDGMISITPISLGMASKKQVHELNQQLQGIWPSID